MTSDEQHGFLQKSSTVTNLTVFTQFISTIFRFPESFSPNFAPGFTYEIFGV